MVATKSEPWFAFMAELWFNSDMDKNKAIDLLGGSVARAAEALDITYQAVSKWPDPLTERIKGRVIAYLVRKKTPRRVLEELSERD